ncbi:hypothetical protein GALMADRAFT_146163 [Galerina marginata CBS 339.88]|uniref:Uncharacterized protein n=1 Tax=Galerina marginata (strain CBS 339.88) TaxID=685588 RepID=A0A067SC99_GALM3|nr:hypothetical protein GALMADRAFT_146163 [Galerina marginata CBS 339.88]
MTPRPRLVVVEDTDSAIQYTGPWFQNTGTNAKIGSPSGTLHGVNSNASFSFTFIGFQVTLYGTIDAPTTSPSGGMDLTWACSVDGASIASYDTTASPANNIPLCGSTSLSNAMHTLVLQATVLNSSKTFWFDELQYAPSAGVPLDNATVIVDFSDPAIMYDAGWVNIDGGVTTQLTEAGLSFDFIGAQLRWFGIPANTSGTVSRGADFFVDATPPISVTLPTVPGNLSIFNQLIFQTDELAPGKHHLNVKHYISTTGLSLQFFIIQNATIPGSSSNGTSSVKTPSPSSNGTTSVIPPGQTAPSLPSNSIPKSKSSTGTAKFSTGTVAGSTIAGILVITGLILFLFFLRRRKRTVPIVQPFPLSSPSTTTVTELHRTPVPTISILTTGKFARADQSPNASAIASGSNAGSTSVQSGSHPGQTLRHQDSGVRILEREDGPVMELPPLYTQG